MAVNPNRITRKDVDCAVNRLNSALERRDGSYTYRVHSEYNYLVLEKIRKTDGAIDQVIRGIGSRQMYDVVNASFKILVDNVIANHE